MRKNFVVLLWASTLAIACSRSDAGIAAAVKSNLAADTIVSAFDVDVDTQYHVVTLTGRVDSAAERDRAIQIARHTRGVRDVVDRLRVPETAATSGRHDTAATPTGTTGVSDVAARAEDAFADTAMTSKVKAALLGDDRIAGLKITVRTDNGVVMLHGDVRSRADASRAVMLTQQVKGVRTVVDNLHVH